jgi:hypothetical protein
MLQTVLNALFGCSHQRTTFPQTATRRNMTFAANGARTYVVCLDCGREFSYDWDGMRVGKPVPERAPAAEVQPMFR